MMTARQKRRLCPGISPSGSTLWVPSIRMYNWLPCSVTIESAEDSEITVEKVYLESSLQDFPELLRLCIAGVLNLQVSSLRHNLLGCEWSLGVSPS